MKIQEAAKIQSAKLCVELRSLEEWRDIANGFVPRDSNKPERKSEVVINRPNDITFCNICKQHFQSGYNEVGRILGRFQSDGKF